MSDKTVYSYINDIAQRLKEPRKYGDVSLMIGAGFSKNAQSKGMASMQPPNWSELAEKMYEELYPEPLGCYPLTGGIESEADTLDEIIDETLSAVSSERTSRVIDHEAAGSMERRKREGYF